MNNFAPVLIITLNRYQHFKRCIESLAKCTHADKTELYIALDYPANETHWEGYKKIESFLPKIRGFQKLIIIKRDENFGIEKNFSEGMQIIFKNHDRIIFIEDDNVMSPYFLQYMNDGLEFYKDNKKIIAINGYNIPTEFSKDYGYDFYLSKYFNSWGFATWANRKYLDIIEYDAYYEIMNDLRLYKKIKLFHPKLINKLKQIHEGNLNAGDYMIVFHLLKNDLYTIKPIKSLVKNIGHDGSGIHCGISDRYNAEPYNKRINIIDSELPKYDENYDKQYYLYFNPKVHLLNRLKNKLKKISRIK